MKSTDEYHIYFYNDMHLFIYIYIYTIIIQINYECDNAYHNMHISQSTYYR